MRFYDCLSVIFGDRFPDFRNPCKHLHTFNERFVYIDPFGRWLCAGVNTLNEHCRFCSFVQNVYLSTERAIGKLIYIFAKSIELVCEHFPILNFRITTIPESKFRNEIQSGIELRLDQTMVSFFEVIFQFSENQSMFQYFF